MRKMRSGASRKGVPKPEFGNEVLHSPLTTHHSLTHHSLTHHSPLTTHLLTTHLLTTHHSPTSPLLRVFDLFQRRDQFGGGLKAKFGGFGEHFEQDRFE